MSEWQDVQTERDFGGALEQISSPDGVKTVGTVGHLSHASKEEIGLWLDRMPELDPETRQRVVKTLVDSAEGDVHVDFTLLLESLLDDDDAEVRAATIDGLWESEAPRFLDRYVEMIGHDRSALVRARASAALGAFVKRSELRASPVDGVEQALTCLIDRFSDESEDADVRRRAIESSGFASRAEIEELIEQAIRSHELELQAGALRAMGNSADHERWGDEVVSWLDDASPELRFEAARSAGELELKSALPLLSTLASEDDREIRFEAIWALGEIGTGAAKGVLERLAEDAVDEDEVDAIDEAMATVALGEGDIDYWSNPLGRDAEGSATPEDR